MTKKQVSVSLNSDVVNAIDRDRGDVSRSLYLRKLITEVVYKELNEDLTPKYKNNQERYAMNV